jgi:hypothetical protein
MLRCVAEIEGHRGGAAPEASTRRYWFYNRYVLLAVVATMPYQPATSPSETSVGIATSWLRHRA